MNFLNPLFLFGLIAVAIPVIIHLINVHRPQTISFSTLSFFNELRKSTIRRIRIKRFLLMSLRVLALLFLAIALARPFLSPTMTGATSSREKVVALVIDNSPSMSRTGTQGPLITQAKEIAIDVIDNGSSDDKFLIVSTNGGKAVNIKPTGAEQAKRDVSEVSVRNTAHYTRGIVRAVYEQLQSMGQTQGVIYLISDGQKSQLEDLLDLNPQSQTEGMNAIPLQIISLEEVKQQNMAIIGIKLNSRILKKNAPFTLDIEVMNVGGTAVANNFVSIEVDGKLVGQYKVSLQAGQSKNYSFQVTPGKAGAISGRIILEGDEVTYDNTRNFVVHIPPERSVLLIRDENGDSPYHSYLTSALEAAQQTNAQIRFVEKTVSEVEHSQWMKYNVIALDGLKQVPAYWFQELQQYVQKGRGLLFLPSEQGHIQNYNTFFELFNAGRFTNVLGTFGSFRPVVKMGNLSEHPVISDLFEINENERINVELPSIFFYYKYEPSSTSLAILETANGNPLLTEHLFGNGVFIISTIGAGPGWSNFPVNPLFAPIFYRSLLYASSEEAGGLKKHKLGTPFTWTGNLSAERITLELNGEKYKPKINILQDGVQIFYEGLTWTPGILTIKGSEEVYKIAVNQSIMESRFDTLNEEQWRETLEQTFSAVNIIKAVDLSPQELNEKLKTAIFGKKIWNWFIWLALVLLIAETLVSRLYRAESIS